MGVPGYTYELEYSVTLNSNSWIQVGNMHTPTTTAKIMEPVTVVSLSGRLFFRVALKSNRMVEQDAALKGQGKK